MISVERSATTIIIICHAHDDRRAMTVVLLDKVGEQVRGKFGFSKEEMPLVKVLEGGTWKVWGVK